MSDIKSEWTTQQSAVLHYRYKSGGEALGAKQPLVESSNDGLTWVFGHRDLIAVPWLVSSCHPRI